MENRNISSCSLKRLVIKNFRNITFRDIEFQGDKLLVTGPNGSGKTSMLEAISLLAVGKGFRGERFANLVQQDPLNPENNSQDAYLRFELAGYLGDIVLEQVISRETGKRSITLNSQPISANELVKFSAILWLVPQQNTLFQESSTARRKFFDRIVYSFEHEHATNLNKYEHYQRERLHLLLQPSYDESWIEIIEGKIVDLAMILCESRWKILRLLNEVLENLQGFLPLVKLNLSSELDQIYESQGDDSRAAIAAKLKQTRVVDGHSHKTGFGAMKMDFMPFFDKKKMNANLCSTGEQQSCLISILIAHTELFLARKHQAPILLLDEVFVHLDEENKSILSKFLSQKNIQVFVTSTEKELCSDFFSHSDLVEA